MIDVEHLALERCNGCLIAFLRSLIDKDDEDRGQY